MAELGYHITTFNADINASNDEYVMGPFGTSETGTITEFHFYGKSTSASHNLRGVIYIADGADPGSVLWTGPEIAINSATPQWWSNTGLSVAFTAPIYIGFWQQDDAGPNYYHDGTTGAGFFKGETKTYASTGDAKTPWEKDTDTPTTQRVGVYVVYTPSGPANITGQVASPFTFGSVIDGQVGSPGPTNVTPPSVTGTAQVGETLTCDPGEWTI